MVYNTLIAAIVKPTFPTLPSYSMKPITIFVLSIVTGLSLLGCKNPNADTKGEEDDKGIEEIVAIPVKVAAAKSGPISSYLEFDSILETESAVEVHPESSGLVVAVMAEVGDSVEAGQVIAQLENEEQEVNVRESLSRYQHLQSKFKRTEDLFKRNLINQQEYDTEVFDLEQAEINYERSRIRLEDTLIRAPVSGVVAKRLTQEGERVTTSKVLFSLLNMDELFAQVNIPGQHMLKLQKGLKAKIVSEIIEGISYDAVVKLVSPAIDSASGTFNVKVSVDPNSQIPIYPGMFVSVRIVMDTKENAIIIPKAAIVHEGEKTFIYTVNDLVARKQAFQPGYDSSETIESISGVKDGDSVIVLGHNSLKDGATVKIVEESLSAEKSAETENIDTSEG